jgi:DNA-binding transcriptional MocR family regulator
MVLPLEQTVLVDFIAEGYLERYIQRMRSLYDQCQQAMVKSKSSPLSCSDGDP